MVKVECDGCKAPYQIDETRIPPTGLRMRCPKCGTNLLVTRLGAASPAADVGLPAPVAPPPRGGVQPSAKSPPRRVEGDGLDLPIAAASGDANRRAGFGEIDFGEPELPAPIPKAGRPQTAKGGMAPRMPPAGSPFVPQEPDAAGPGGGGFGELMVDLPALASFSTSDPGAELTSVDLPVIRGGGPEMELDESDMAAEFGNVDLPTVHGDEPGLPGLPKVGADLPEVRGGRALAKPRGRTVPFGGGEPPDEPDPKPVRRPKARPAPPLSAADLLKVADATELPQPRRGKAPREAPRAFGEIDLPLISVDDALPLRSPGGELPVATPSAGLPVAATAVGMPVLATGGGLPVAATAVGMPAHAPGGGLPVAATAEGMPAPTSFGIEPSAFSGDEFDPFGHDSQGQRPGQPTPAPQDVGEELSLGSSAGPSAGSLGAFDDSDRAVSIQGTGAARPNMAGAIALTGSGRDTVGDEVELSSEAAGVRAGPRSPRAPRPWPDAIDAPQKRSSTRRIAIATAVLLAVGGASLALEPSIGPFGASFISDQLNAKKYAASLADLRAAVQADLDEDTSTSAGRALQKAKDALAAAPRHRPTAAYCAYVIFARSIRFSHRGEAEAFAKQLLAAASREPSAALSLATAADAAVSGQFPKARDALAPLASSSPDDHDVTSLAGEIELGARDTDKAIAAWKLAIGSKKSARALFGLARAQRAAGDAAGAEATVNAVLEASPQHAGARILLASVLWQSEGREGDAVLALKKVTEDPSVRGAASDAEIVEAFTLLGRIHLGRSRMSAAEQAFVSALKLDPQAIQALIGNGELFYQSGRYSEASARFEAAMRTDDGSVAAKIGTAKTWLALERMREAKDLLKKLREGHASDPAVAYWLGRVEEALGNKPLAEAAYNDAIKVGQDRPEVVDTYVTLARLLSGIGRTDEANQKLLEASKRFPDLPALHKAKGELMLQTGRFEEAKHELSAALDKEDDLGTRFKLGVALRRLRAFDDAVMVFDKVASVDKDYPGLALERGILFEATGQSARALEMYSDALRKAPNDVDLKLRVGSTQVIAGHADQAEVTLREVVKARPSSAEANHYLGRALLVRGTNLTEAMRSLEAAVNIDANRAEYHLYVGWCANEAGQPGRAEVALKKALELDRELADAYWQRGVMLQKQGATVDALADLTTALAKNPSRHEAYATMALCFQDQQRWPEAEQAFRKAIASNGSVPEWHYRLGKLSATHGSQLAAGPELELAVTLAEASDRAKPPWLYDAHFLLAEALRGTNREKAIQSYRRFLELAPRGNAYIVEAQRALAILSPSRER